MRLHDYWRAYTYDVVVEHGGDPTVSPKVFNARLADLRADFHEDDDIRMGFFRFAEMVRQGKIDVRGKTAWFVFYGRRYKLIRPTPKKDVSISDAQPPKMDWSRVPQPRSPFKQG